MAGKTILIQGEGLGRGDDRLGQMLMASFLRLLGESQRKPGTIAFWNTGVKLMGPDSPVLDHLKRLEGQGVEILACTTCLEYFDLLDKIVVGKATTMVKSIATMLGEEVVTL